MLYFTKHAKIRMEERGILKKDVERVIINPDKIFRENDRVIVSKRIDKKTLEVIYVIENSKKIILTCYYL